MTCEHIWSKCLAIDSDVVIYECIECHKIVDRIPIIKISKDEWI